MDLQDTLGNVVDKIIGWVEAFILMLPNLLVAALIVVVFWWLAKLARKVILNLMDRVSSMLQVNKLLATTGYVAVLAIGTFIALTALNLSGAVTSLLAGAGIIGLALGFAFQDIAANYISGILMAVRRPFTERDIVETNGYFGTVEDVNLRSTVLRTFQGQHVIIPNKEVFQSPVVNYTRGQKRRVDVSCGVAYGDDLEEAERIALEAVRGIEYRDTSKDVDLYYEEFGDSSINFVIRFWVVFSKQTDFLKARSDAIKRIKGAFDEHGITIPFPIRTLDFGVVGGEKLNEVLPQHFYDKQDNGEA